MLPNSARTATEVAAILSRWWGVNASLSVARAPGVAGVLPFAINHATG